MRIGNNQFILLIIFMFLGLTFTIQIRSNIKVNMQKPSSVQAAEDLKRQIEEENAEIELLKQKIKDNEEKNEAFLKAAVDYRGDEELNNRLQILDIIKLKAGLTDVKGAGVTIKLDDAAIRVHENPNLLIIHDRDVISVINELKRAGAQAISINGERLLSTSEQVCAGPTIRINKKRYATPYIINAIGDPDQLMEELNKSGQIAMLIEDNIRVEITKMSEITIPKYSGNIENLITGLEVLER